MSAEALFVYGTLLHAAILQAVTGARFPRRAARLAGFERRALHGELFPGLIEAPGAQTDGALLEGVGAAALAALDRFEGDGYRRRRVVVATEAGPRGASAYVLAPAHRHRVTRFPWNPVDFERFQLSVYLARCRRSTAGSLR